MSPIGRPPYKTAAVNDALARAPDIVVPLVREVPPEILKRRPAPGKWSAHEHACRVEGLLLNKEWAPSSSRSA